MVLGGRTHRSQAITKKTQQQHSASVLPYKTVLCCFVNHDPWQDNTGVITSSNRPLETTCCCHGRSQQRPELRVVRPWFDWTAIEKMRIYEDFVAVPTEIGQKCGHAGVAQNF
eukprot:scaffold67454_cov44-Cyclotella_meneghiniana.AAC.4